LPRLPLQPEEQSAVQVLRSGRGVDRSDSAGRTYDPARAVAEVFSGAFCIRGSSSGLPANGFCGKRIGLRRHAHEPGQFLPLLVLALILTVLYERTNKPARAHRGHALFMHELRAFVPAG